MWPIHSEAYRCILIDDVSRCGDRAFNLRMNGMQLWRYTVHGRMYMQVPEQDIFCENLNIWYWLVLSGARQSQREMARVLKLETFHVTDQQLHVYPGSFLYLCPIPPVNGLQGPSVCLEFQYHTDLSDYFHLQTLTWRLIWMFARDRLGGGAGTPSYTTGSWLNSSEIFWNLKVHTCLHLCHYILKFPSNKKIISTCSLP